MTKPSSKAHVSKSHFVHLGQISRKLKYFTCRILKLYLAVEKVNYNLVMPLLCYRDLKLEASLKSSGPDVVSRKDEETEAWRCSEPGLSSCFLSLRLLQFLTVLQVGMSRLLRELCSMSAVCGGGRASPRLGSGHCKEVALRVTLDSFALLPR